MTARSDVGGSDLNLPEVLEATDTTVPRGYRRKAGMTVVENVHRDEARDLLEMLGIGSPPAIREQGESIV